MNPMKPTCALIIAALVVGASGCMGDRTKNMAATCQELLDGQDPAASKQFLLDAKAQLASLDVPANRITAALRDLQDHDAMTYKPALEQCVWQLKSR